MVVIYKSEKEIVEKGLKSVNSDNKCKLTFQNKSTEVIRISWVDYGGKRVVYKDGFEPGCTFTQDTFKTHPWVLESEDITFAAFVVPLSYDQNEVNIIIYNGTEKNKFGKPNTEIAVVGAFEDIIVRVGDKIADKQLRSVSYNARCEITFKNQSTEVISIFWADYEGKHIIYKNGLRSGQSYTQSTFKTHPWILEGNGIKFAWVVVPSISEASQFLVTIKSTKEERVDRPANSGCFGRLRKAIWPEPAPVVIKWTCEGKKLDSGQITNISTGENIDADLIKCTTVYEERDIHGFKVFLEPNTEHDVITALSEDLLKITQNVNPSPLQLLLSVKIYVNKKIRFGKSKLEADNWDGAVFHPAAEWLVSHGNQAEKAGSVELYATDSYLQRRNHFGQISFVSNWCLHHELAHAYHYLLTKYQHCDIDDTYNKNMAIGRYNMVNHVQGKRLKAYACNNALEYFASLSASYFAYNDFAPFNKEELLTFDPEGFALMEKYWHFTEDEIVGINPLLKNLFSKKGQNKVNDDYEYNSTSKPSNYEYSTTSKSSDYEYFSATKLQNDDYFQ